MCLTIENKLHLLPLPLPLLSHPGFLKKTALQSALNLDRAHVTAAACKHGSSGSRGWERARLKEERNGRSVCVCVWRKGAGSDHSICAPFPTTAAQKAEILWNPEQPEFPHQHSVSAATETAEPWKRLRVWNCFNIKDSLVNYCSSTVPLHYNPMTEHLTKCMVCIYAQD